MPTTIGFTRASLRRALTRYILLIEAWTGKRRRLAAMETSGAAWIETRAMTRTARPGTEAAARPADVASREKTRKPNANSSAASAAETISSRRARPVYTSGFFWGGRFNDLTVTRTAMQEVNAGAQYSVGAVDRATRRRPPAR